MGSHCVSAKVTAQSVPCVQPTALTSRDSAELLAACAQIQAGMAPPLHALQFKTILKLLLFFFPHLTLGPQLCVARVVRMK